MPTKPNEEELVAFLRTYSCFAGIDVNEFWASVQPEIFNLTARPIDIKQTSSFERDVSSGPTDTTLLTQTFGPTVGNRMLIIRQLRVDDTGANPPDNVLLTIAAPGNFPFYRDSAPSFPDPIGGNNAGSRAVAAQLPFVVYPGNFLEVTFTRLVSALMTMRVIVVGEEFEVPFRNVGT